MKHIGKSLSENIEKCFTTRKEEILNMHIDEKRALYKCGHDFVTLKDIPSWNISMKGSMSSRDPTNNSDIVGSKYTFRQDFNDKISIFEGNITTLEIDAIVNAANSSLLGGGGVDAAIHKAAGHYLFDECKTLSGCETGNAKITFGYDLPAKYIIHTVGPIGEKPQLLESCYYKSLHLAAKHKVRTIAFPCVSTGVYGYPNGNAAQVVLNTIRTFFEANSKDFDRIIFCLFTAEDKRIYRKLLPVYFPLE